MSIEKKNVLYTIADALVFIGFPVFVGIISWNICYGFLAWLFVSGGALYGMARSFFQWFDES